MTPLRQKIAGWILTKVLRVHTRGLEWLRPEQGGLLVIANHDHRWDWTVLASVLPEGAWLALHPQEMPPAWLRTWCHWIHFVPLDPMNPDGIKPLIRHLKNNGVVALFPAGGGLGHGAVGKIADGTARIPELAGVPVAAVLLQGTALWPLGHRWPRINLAVQKPQILTLPHATGEEQRRAARLAMGDLLEQSSLNLWNSPNTLWDALCQAASIHKRTTRIVEDSGGTRLSYGTLITRALILGRTLQTFTSQGERVGVLLPTTAGTLVVFFSLQAFGRVPAMLNFTAGPGPVGSACRTACLKTVLTSRLFVTKAGLETLIEHLETVVKVIFLEDLKPLATRPLNVLAGWLLSFQPNRVTVAPKTEAVILFTSGSEGDPKGVALSHAALLTNIRQVQVRVGLRILPVQDLMLDVLPLFHAFGLTMAALTPLLSGVRLYLHPSPLDYRAIAELAYLIKPTLMVGTDTFLSGYGRAGHPSDFCALRLVFAGGEPLRERTRTLWLEKFGVPIYEGYGTTETGPALTANITAAHRPGTVGRLLPGISYRLTPIPGLEMGGRLAVCGPNLMLGYIPPGGEGQVVPVTMGDESGWYDVGDVVTVDEEGYLRIVGRVRRFAKLGGEMVSLAAVETLAETVWPEHRHAAITLPDPRKGERIVLVTEHPTPDRGELMAMVRQQGLGGIYVPSQIVSVTTIPVLGPGKIDYRNVRAMITE
ncbi:MAG: AMP-binding protein [Magnetococcus sp. YQC-5]